MLLTCVCSCQRPALVLNLAIMPPRGLTGRGWQSLRASEKSYKLTPQQQQNPQPAPMPPGESAHDGGGRPCVLSRTPTHQKKHCQPRMLTPPATMARASASAIALRLAEDAAAPPT